MNICLCQIVDVAWCLSLEVVEEMGDTPARIVDRLRKAANRVQMQNLCACFDLSVFNLETNQITNPDIPTVQVTSEAMNACMYTCNRQKYSSSHIRELKAIKRQWVYDSPKMLSGEISYNPIPKCRDIIVVKDSLEDLLFHGSTILENTDFKEIYRTEGDSVHYTAEYLLKYITEEHAKPSKVDCH